MLLQIAKVELKDLTTVGNPDFRLEQAVFNQSEKVWEIVVSFLVDNPVQKIDPIVFPGYNSQRIYKRLKINDQKEVLGFYIYED